MKSNLEKNINNLLENLKLVCKEDTLNENAIDYISYKYKYDPRVSNIRGIKELWDISVPTLYKELGFSCVTCKFDGGRIVIEVDYYSNYYSKKPYLLSVAFTDYSASINFGRMGFTTDDERVTENDWLTCEIIT